MSVPATSEYTLGGKDVDLTNMVGTIKTPGGATEPCLLKKLADGKLGTQQVTRVQQFARVATPLRELTCHTGSHSVTCHPAEVTFPPLLNSALHPSGVA